MSGCVCSSRVSYKNYVNNEQVVERCPRSDNKGADASKTARTYLGSATGAFYYCVNQKVVNFLAGLCKIAIRHRLCMLQHEVRTLQ